MVTRTKFLLDVVFPVQLRVAALLLNKDEPRKLTELQREAAERGENLGVRSDPLTRLVDLGLARGDRSGYRLTERGQEMKDVLLADESLFFEYMHQIHYARALFPGAREYFTTYRLLLTRAWRQPNRNRKLLMSDLLADLTEAFPGMTITGIEQTTVGKGLSLWREITGGELTRRSTAPIPALLHALWLYSEARGLPPREPILLSEKTREELCIYMLVEPEAVDAIIDRALRISGKLTDKTSLAGRSVLLLEPVRVGGCW